MREITASEIHQKLQLLLKGFNDVLYAPEQGLVDNVLPPRLAGDDPALYQHWEWTQGVGLYGMWKLFENTRDPACLKILTDYYDARLAQGLPAQNVNTTAPVLALSYLAEYTGRQDYMDVCRQWAEYAMHSLPRSEEGGIQHLTSESLNNGELWDDTLFMVVLMLANMGRILGRDDYLDEAEYQFLLHTKYLTDTSTGLWYHGYTFEGRHNFAGALWGRGNSWITVAIPLFLEIAQPRGAVRRFLCSALQQQVAALLPRQAPSGMWRTLLEDEGSYEEASATCGFGFGILKGIRAGLLPESYRDSAMKALDAVLGHIDENGVLQQVSYGTPMGRESKDHYIQIPIRPMPYGQALALFFLMQALEEYPSV